MLQSEYQTICQELNQEMEKPVATEISANWRVVTGEGKGSCSVTVSGEQVTICCHSRIQFCRMLGIAAAHLGSEYEITEEAHFEQLSFMLDCSRNAVPKPETVKRLIRRLALMGYHALMLYTEDTYELEKYPYFGYMRGRYTKAEMKEMDAYAAVFGMEIIPCIQTLAHLNAIFHWNTFWDIRDTQDILLCQEEKSYQLITEMVRTCSECFRSRQIHIGMDEAEMLGKGRYEEKHGTQDRTQILLAHLKRVTEICSFYEMKPMMWSDMFIKGLRQLPEDSSEAAVEEIREKIPAGVGLVYWDYYARQQEKYEQNIEQHQKLSDHIIFAGGAWKWSGFAPLLDHSWMVSRMALESCLKHGIKEVMVTAWGDNGAECSMWTVLPILQLYAEVCYSGNAQIDRAEVARRMQECTAVSFEGMMRTSMLNYIPHNEAPGMLSSGPTKYFFYQDPLLGLFDRHVDPELCAKHYRECAEQMRMEKEQNRREKLVFETLEKLSLVLELKCDYGVRLKKAYDGKDREALQALAQETELIKERMKAFLEVLELQWRTDHKAFGLEVLDVRIGGLMQRMESARKQIESYLCGQTDRIEELEEERLYFAVRREDDGEYPVLENCEWNKMISAADI